MSENKSQEMIVKETTHALDAAGILARGYAYRKDRARVVAIEIWEDVFGTSETSMHVKADAEPDTTCREKQMATRPRIVGLMLVRDLTEAHACYDLQQFMIDERAQNRGIGTVTQRLLLDELREERRLDMVEVCVKKDDVTALHVYEKAGFKDSGYIDDDAPDSLNLVYRF